MGSADYEKSTAIRFSPLGRWLRSALRAIEIPTMNGVVGNTGTTTQAPLPYERSVSRIGSFLWRQPAFAAGC
jgi:hypothetical protein